MADGVYLMGGGPANSYMVEFDSFVAVFEAPDERRAQPRRHRGHREAGAREADSLADQLAPALRSHRGPAHLPPHRLHHRHAHEEPRVPQPRRAELRAAHGEARHRVAKWPPTEVSEGYNYEAVQENYVITDNRRILRVYYVQPLQHAEGMLMAYLPAERIAFQADLFDTHEAPRSAQLPSMRTLATQVRA